MKQLLLVVSVSLATAGCGAPKKVNTQGASWVGESVIYTKHPEGINFVQQRGDLQTSLPYFGTLPIRVGDESDGWLRIQDGRRDGWVDKANFVRLRDAPAFFNERLLEKPSDVWALAIRGAVWIELGELDSAIQDFGECIRLDPTDVAAFNNRGIVHAKKQEFAKAIKDFDEAIRLRPDDARALNNRGTMWSNTQDYDKAIKDYDEAIRLAPKYA